MYVSVLVQKVLQNFCDSTVCVIEAIKFPSLNYLVVLSQPCTTILYLFEILHVTGNLYISLAIFFYLDFEKGKNSATLFVKVL